MRTTGKQFSANINHSITKAELYDFVARYRKIYGTDTAGFFDKKAVQVIISQQGAAGMRYYYGLFPGGAPALILVGADKTGNDLIHGEPPKLSLLNPPLTLKGAYDPAAADHTVHPGAATQLTAHYRAQAEPRQPKGGFFGKDAVQKILEQPGCVGLRYYLGANQRGRRVVCLMGADRAGRDMADGYLAEFSFWCPPFCSDDNFLNSAISGAARSHAPAPWQESEETVELAA